MPTNTRKRRIARQQWAFLVLLLLALGFGVYWLQGYLEDRDKIVGTFTSPSGQARGSFLLEVADTVATRQKGLMFRKEGSLEPDEGMVFVFPRSAIQEFWMRNTFLSLDIIFIRWDGEVVGILEKVPPLNQKRRAVDKPSRIVVELLAGAVEQSGIQVGDQFKTETSLIEEP